MIFWIKEKSTKFHILKSHLSVFTLEKEHYLVINEKSNKLIISIEITHI